MKLAAMSLVLFVAVAAPAEARGSRGFGSTYHALRSSPYSPARTYSCPRCNSNDHYVAPTIRTNGRRVRGHMQSDSNPTRVDNFSHRGNTNPYTGKPGPKD
jgi:hypothetical protein